MMSPSDAPADSPVDLSFVIPVYNSAPWIEECVRSALRQSGIRVEVICVDDGSTDASNEIIRAMAEEDFRIVLLEQTNSGQSVARNIGVDAAQGRYVAFLDSDDFWQVDAASALIDIADRDDLDVLLFDGHARLDGDVESAVWERYAGYYQRDERAYPPSGTGIDLMARMRRRGDYRPHVGLYLTRTSFLRESKVRFIPGIVHQDNAYTFALMLRAQRVRHLAEDVYARRLRPNSTITALDAYRSVLGYLTAYASMRRELAIAHPSYRQRRPLADIVRYALRGAVKRYAELPPKSLDSLRAALQRSGDHEVMEEIQRRGQHRTTRFRRR